MPTAYEIYQTYLKGPAALIRLFEQALGTAAIYGQPPPDLQQRTIESQAEEIDRLKRQIARMQAEMSELRHHNFQLLRRNSELEALISRDSHNSSRPPSSDLPWAKRTKSLRRPSGKRPGGQAGHTGHTRPLTAKPTRVIRYHPTQCRRCHATLDLTASRRYKRRQVIDIIPARLRITEHRAEVVRCKVCGTLTKGDFPKEVRAPLQYGPSVSARALYLHDYQLLPYERTSEAMRDLFGCLVSAGTLANIVRECASALIETELKIKRKLRYSAVLHADETGLRVGKRLQYVHVASTPRLTHYATDARRGRGAIDEIGILPQYRGTCVHDGWLSYTYYPQCRHALCGAHLLRELTYFAELGEGWRGWAEPLLKLLLEMKAEVERVSERGYDRLTPERLMELRASYDQLVAQGLEANPPPEVADQVKKQARNLLLRLERRQPEVLRFLTDFQVPFDNNQAERDLRMIKLQQKTSGCFRTEEGARQFCRIRSYLSTMRKQGKGVLLALEKACRGVPLSPTRCAN